MPLTRQWETAGSLAGDVAVVDGGSQGVSHGEWSSAAYGSGPIRTRLPTMRLSWRATKVEAWGLVMRVYQTSSAKATSRSYVDKKASGAVFRAKSRKSLVLCCHVRALSSSRGIRNISTAMPACDMVR